MSPYKRNAALGITFNLLTAIFGLFSFAMMMPFLNVLFGLSDEIYTIKPVLEMDYKSFEAWFMWHVQDIMLSNSKVYGLFFISGLIVILSLLKNISRYMAVYIIAPLRMGIIRDIRNKLFKKILRLPISYYSDEKRGDIISKMTSDVTEIEISVMRSIDMLFKDPILLIVYISGLLWISWELTLFVFILLPITGGIIGTIGKNLRKTGFKSQQLLVLSHQ